MAEIAQTFSIDPYAAERSKIARQQKFAELLQSQALQPNEKFSYAGIEAPISAASGLAKALQAGMSGYLQGDAARKEDELATTRDSEEAAAISALNTGFRGTPENLGRRGMSPATKEDVASRALSISQGSTAPPLTLGEPVDVLGGLGALGTEGTPGTAAVPGGISGAMTALGRLTDNKMASRMLQSLQMKQIEASLKPKEFASARDGTIYNKNTGEVVTTGSGPDGKGPMSIQEWDIFKKMLPDEQERYLAMKRAAPWLNLGGSQVAPSQVSPAGPPLANVTNTLKPGELPAVQGQQAAAVAAATSLQKKQDNLPRAQSAVNSLKQQSGIVVKTIDSALELAKNEYATGLTGAVLSSFPDTDARALKNDLITIRANIGFDKLDAIRSNAITGGALGNVSDYETRLLQAVNGALDPLQRKQLVKNLTAIKELYPQVLAERERAFQQDYGDVLNPDKTPPQKVSPSPDSSSPPMSALTEGINTTFKNGEVWTLRNGIAVKVN